MEVTRSHLESLSTAELITLADNYGIDIPPDLERIFIIEELLECTKTEEEPKEEININPSYSETVMLPKQYNFSYIDIITRDPLWVYVFWEIKAYDKENYENSPDFKGYFLRIVSSGKDSFTIPIEANDNARYIGFASEADFAEHSNLESDCYRIELGLIREDTEIQIAVSRSFRLPRLITNDDIQRKKDDHLARLSGIADLPIIIDMQKSLPYRGQ